MQIIKWYYLNDTEVRAMLYNRKGDRVIAYLTDTLENIQYYFQPSKFKYVYIG